MYKLDNIQRLRLTFGSILINGVILTIVLCSMVESVSMLNTLKLALYATLYRGPRISIC